MPAQHGDHWFLATAIGDVVQRDFSGRLQFLDQAFVNRLGAVAADRDLVRVGPDMLE